MGSMRMVLRECHGLDNKFPCDFQMKALTGFVSTALGRTREMDLVQLGPEPRPFTTGGRSEQKTYCNKIKICPMLESCVSQHFLMKNATKG